MDKLLEERNKEFEERFVFGKQYPIDGEEYTIVGHKHDGSCEFGCDKQEKLLSFQKETIIKVLDKVREDIEEIMSDWESVTDTDNPVTIRYIKNQLLENLTSLKH